LQAENDKLKKQVEELKRQLTDVEAMNGRKQIFSPSAVESGSVLESKATKVQPVAPPPLAPKTTAPDAKENKKKVNKVSFNDSIFILTTF
jgi:hypothetical protein